MNKPIVLDCAHRFQNSLANASIKASASFSISFSITC